MINRSDIGKVRQVNEDSSLVGQLNEHIAYAIVADGMGGHQAGDVASQLAVQAFSRIISQNEEVEHFSIDDAKRLMKIAIREANTEIYKLASQFEQYHNMGTTIVAALVWDHQMVIGHVGDSRAYLVSDESLQQITQDHSLVNALVQSGQLTAEEAEHHPRRNVLTRAIGTDDSVEIDITVMEWTSVDEILLLCSDGLTNRVSDGQLHQVLTSELSLTEKADLLIELALQAGGDDNITLVLGTPRDGLSGEVGQA